VLSKLEVDRCIHLPSQWHPRAVVAGQFLTDQPKALTIKQSKSVNVAPDKTVPKIAVKASTIVEGANAKRGKEHRNFHWLGYWGGAISQIVRHGNIDVLTGPMSGCWVVVHRWHNIEHVAHIGKDKMDQAKTNAVIAGWNGHAQAHPDDVIAGFNPFRHWVDRMPERKPGDKDIGGTGYQCFALVTGDPAPRLFSILTYRQKIDTNLLRIAGIEEVESEGRETLLHTD